MSSIQEQMVRDVDNPLIIYHGNCFDGFTAAWAVRKFFIEERGVEVECHPVVYPEAGQLTELPDCNDRHVFMVDFCVSRKQLIQLRKEAQSLLVLDHHKTHEEACSGLPFCVFDMRRSGAGIAWDWFFAERERPWLVNYVEDRDLWKFDLFRSETINAFIMCREMTWENWDEMAAMPPAEAQVLGSGAQLYLERYVRDMRKVARRVDFPIEPNAQCTHSMGGCGCSFYRGIPVVNAPYLGTSELVGSLAEDEPSTFAVGWFQRADGLYQYSLRSKGDFDVSELAKRFGGGGHAKAAGFTVKERVHG